MKKLYLLVILALTIHSVKSQSLSPSVSGEYCPNVDYTFAFSVSGDNRDIFPSGVSYLSVSAAQNISYNSVIKLLMK